LLALRRKLRTLQFVLAPVEVTPAIEASSFYHFVQIRRDIPCDDWRAFLACSPASRHELFL
jgi:hypothetical protein